MPVSCRPARLGDVPLMRELINAYAGRDLMLPRNATELYETIRDFQVVENADGRVIGCAAVHIITAAMAELKSLAVAESESGRGLGRMLVEACCASAAGLGLEGLFCLTYQVDFFRHLGFATIDRARLPEKVWGECVRCNRFLDCTEVAMWRDLPTGR